MNVSLYQAAAAMNAHSRWQELITENLANNSIPGYKKQDTSFTAVEANLAQAQANSNFLMPHVIRSTNFLPGEITATGNHKDIAIQGPGFLQMQLPDGTPAFTRNGALGLDSTGQLITNQGHPVMGERGPIQLNLRNTNFTVDASGQVFQDGELKDKLMVAEFNDPALLTPMGAGCFLANNPQIIWGPATATTLQQGFLENSNASSMIEMGNLVTSMRLFESAQRVITMTDERMGRLISELGRPT